MATPRRYYWHGMTPYAYDWDGSAYPAEQRARGDLGEVPGVVVGLGGVVALVLLLTWFGAKK